MNKFGASISIAAAVGYTLAILFMIAFAFAFFSLDDLGKDRLV